MASQTESNNFPHGGNSNSSRSALTRLSSVARTSTVPENDEPVGEDLDWSKMPEVQTLEQGHEGKAHVNRKLGLTWTNLSVFGRAAGSSFHENVVSQFLPARLKGGSIMPTEKTILSKSHGCVKPGEMLLVLGRPGSGCSTLLNVLGNRRDGYTRVEGQVKYGSMDYSEALKYRG